MISSVHLHTSTQAFGSHNSPEGTSEQLSKSDFLVDNDGKVEVEIDEVDDWPPLHSLSVRDAPETPFNLSLTFPSFLIHLPDGLYTPYTNRSPVSSPIHEIEDPIRSLPSPTSSPTTATTSARSHEVSAALKALLDQQEQAIIRFSATWAKKYPLRHLPTESEIRNTSPEKTALRDGTVKWAHSIVIRSKRLDLKPLRRPIILPDVLSEKSASKPRSRDVIEKEFEKTLRLERKLKNQLIKKWLTCLPRPEQFAEPFEQLE